MKTNKLRTIDDVCDVPKGSFKKFIKKQKQDMQRIERNRKKRIMFCALDGI